ncbi:hypothetical protein [Jannaschia aquimarina]|uniref:Uncharacterized protein n=1 Tax=Jannaschia aquimarina TaxID=935700 RepID=A0A0D1DDE0_9RHOB|nr:hypothetical protein [Jannaschia aquimarina]KIT18013.1 hypothetical protein jaqu_02400 [Jannaschia aquimarina]SNS88549.1 hypothetical protein SAMN05421775_103161 [Jannaschia aquimarina]
MKRGVALAALCAVLAVTASFLWLRSELDGLRYVPVDKENGIDAANILDSYWDGQFMEWQNRVMPGASPDKMEVLRAIYFPGLDIPQKALGRLEKAEINACGADLTAPDQGCHTLLRLAIERFRFDMSTALLDAGADPLFNDGVEMARLLAVQSHGDCAAEPCFRLVNDLLLRWLEAGGRDLLRSDAGPTSDLRPLMLYLRPENANAARLLLEAGADPWAVRSGAGDKPRTYVSVGTGWDGRVLHDLLDDGLIGPAPPARVHDAYARLDDHLAKLLAEPIGETTGCRIWQILALYDRMERATGVAPPASPPDLDAAIPADQRRFCD